jgi:hypothetical protein
MYAIINFGLTFGMSQRSPISTVCGVVYVFYYVWQIIDAVRSAKAMRSACAITNLSTIKRATIAAGMVLALVAVSAERVFVEDRFGKTTSAAAADRTAVPHSTSADQTTAPLTSLSNMQDPTCATKECMEAVEQHNVERVRNRLYGQNK